MEHIPTVDDVSKSIIDANGDRLGTVSKVEDGVALVDPAADVPPSVEVALGWMGDSGPYPLPSASIASVTETSIHLRSSL
jgi:hypothetical protein